MGFQGWGEREKEVGGGGGFILRVSKKFSKIISKTYILLGLKWGQWCIDFLSQVIVYMWPAIKL